MTLAARPVGYFHEVSRSLADHQLETTDEMKLVIGRLGSKVVMTSRAVTLESDDGKFVACDFAMSSSGREVRTVVKMVGSKLESDTVSGGRHYLSESEVKDPVAGPQAIIRECSKRLSRTGDKLVVNAFEPTLGKIARNTYEVASGGRVFLATEGLPGRQELALDGSGQFLTRIQELPFGKLVLSPASKDSAKAMAGGGRLPDDMFGSTLARSNIRLPDPRSIERMRIEIVTKRPDLGWPDLDSGNQRVLFKDRRRVVLQIERVGLPQVPRLKSRQVPNAFLQSDDPNVVKLASQLGKGSRSLYETARREQDWVAEHARLDAGIALAPASETVTTCKGTCLAFAVLLASLERASGLPSRVAMGYVYEQGIWGGHAWTEVELGDRWVPLDAAMYSAGPADAARFSFVKSDLADGADSLSGPGLQMYGNVSVRVLEYTIGGKTVGVPQAARPFSIRGDEYRNPWLGLKLRKGPRGKFIETDKVYPNPTVVAIRYSGGVVRVGTRSGGPSARASSASVAGEYAITIRLGTTIWTVRATGPRAEGLVRATLAASNLRRART
jgi:hypothetical protein